MAALHRAVALAEVDGRPVRVREELDLDVARALDVALAEDPVVAEPGRGLAASGLERLFELLRGAHEPHAAPAPAGRRLDHEGEADLLGIAALDDRNAGLRREPLRFELVPGRADRLRRRADEPEAGRDDRLGEARVLGQEPVAGVDRVRTGARRRGDDSLDVEIARHLLDLGGAPRVERAGVVGRGHGHSRDPEPVAGGEDPRGDLAAVRYEELSDLHAGLRFSRKARSPSWPSALVRRAAAISAAA